MPKGQGHPFIASFFVFILLILVVLGFAYEYPVSFSKYFGYTTIEQDCPPGENCVEYHYVRVLFEIIILYALSSFIVHLARKYFM